MPNSQFERVTHYDTTLDAGPSPIRCLRGHLRIAPLSDKSQTSEDVAIPAALRPSRPSAREMEAKKLREEALRLQEEQEERELKLRRKVGVVLK